MALIDNFDDLIRQINGELNDLKRDLAQTIAIVRGRINSFPENVILMQLYSTLNNYDLFAQNTQRRIQAVLRYLALSKTISDKGIQELGEDLSEQLGRVIEAKIVVNTIKKRLERLP